MLEIASVVIIIFYCFVNNLLKETKNTWVYDLQDCLFHNLHSMQTSNKVKAFYLDH